MAGLYNNHPCHCILKSNYFYKNIDYKDKIIQIYKYFILF